MTGNIPVDTEDDVAELACEAMYVDLQDELPEGEEVRKTTREAAAFVRS